tara:strand:+ start:113 stop:655 length:543 start_codon:yes stop_codon:yes gene_type:complete
MKILLHLLTLVVTITLVVVGILAWKFGLELIQAQTFYYDGVVDGEITRVKPEVEGDSLSPGLRYEFEVGGHRVKGTNYRQNLIRKKELSKAREIATTLKPGAEVKVYYRVGAGGKVHSVLDPHPDPMAHLLYAGGVPLSFFAVGLYLSVVALRPRDRSKTNSSDSPPSEPTEKKTSKDDD